MKFLPYIRHCVYWVLAKIWDPNSSHKICNKCFIHHCQGWKEDSFVCETVFFPRWILIRFVSIEILTWNFRKKLFRESFLEKLCKPRLFSTKICEILPYFLQFHYGSILHWKIPKIFTQVFSYVVCTQLRRHIHKKITKRRYREEKSGCVVFRNLVLFTLGLGLITPYSLGLLV